MEQLIKQGGSRGMKSVRHAMILDVIESMDIETQEELADELRARGVGAILDQLAHCR